MKKRILKSEEKELLIKDLLPRIPTNLFVDVPDEEEPKELGKIVRWRIVFGRARSLEDCLDGLIPYLRPLSSMTEEELAKYHSLCDSYYDIYFDTGSSIDWLNAHHFDYRGLIKKGLAIAVTEENNPYKE